MMRNRTIGAILIGLVALTFSSAASAGITVTANVGGAPTGAILDNLDGLPLGGGGGTTTTGIAVSFTGDGQAVTGQAGQYAPPYLSGQNGVGFGNSPIPGQDQSTYLTSGIGSAKLSFGADMHYVGLLWGSVDNYNTLSLYSLGSLVGTIVEGDFANNVNGDQGTNGTYYVNIGTTFAFDTIVASSTQYAFEIDNIAYSPDQYCPTCGTTGTLVPEPITASLFGVGLAGAVTMRRRKKKAA
jgi:hypothetical protein